MQETPLLYKTFTDAHKGRAGHINIQHYAQLIDDATKVFLADLDLGNQQSYFAVDEKVRFLAELHAGDEVGVHIDLHQFDQKMLQITGELRKSEDAAPACRFQRTIKPWDIKSKQPSSWQKLPEMEAVAVDSDISAIEPEFQGRVLNIYASQVDAHDSDEHGVMTPRALWHLMTEALWATQTKLGAGQSVLQHKGIGGGAAIFHLQHNRPIPQGAALTVSTSAIGLSESSIRMQHDIRSSDQNSEPLLRALYVTTFIDRAKGKRCPVSEVFPGVEFGHDSADNFGG